jgi:hypothetical protein
MNQKIVIAAVGIVLAGGLLYFARNSKQPPVQQTQGLIKANGPVIENICVENIQNLSHQPVNMDGMDDELVAQLQKVGFSANKVSTPNGKPCSATINAELVEITGRGRKTARVDFRLTLAGEQPPRISASAHGKSSENAAQAVASNVKPTAFVESKPDKTPAEREATVAALTDQAVQIHDAYARGLPPWLPAEK